MNTKTVDINSLEGTQFTEDDFIFNNNEEDVAQEINIAVNSTRYNDDPFKSLNGKYVESAKKSNQVGSASGFIKVFTLLFFAVLIGWIFFVVYSSNNPDIIPGYKTKSKFSLSPDNVEAKTNNSERNNK